MHHLELGHDDTVDDKQVRVRVVRFCIAGRGLGSGVG